MQVMTKKRQKSRTLARSAAVAAVAAVAVGTSSSCSEVCVGAFSPQHLLQPLLTASTASNVAAGPTSRRNRRSGGVLAAVSSSVDDATESSSDRTGKKNDTVSSSSSIVVPPLLLHEEFDNHVKQARASSRGLGAALREKIGTVDESRLVFPELTNGDVSRMFSNIEYSKSADGKMSAVHAAGSTLGATALIAGTTIGASVLALPTATAPAGFVPSSAGLCLAWVYMVISGLLISELTINRIGETGRPGVGLIDVYKSSLGKEWAAAGTIAYFFLQYAIMVAYVAQGGVNLDSFLEASGLESVTGIPGFGQIAFASTIGVSLFFAKPSAVQKVNSVLVVGVVGTFLAIMGFGARTADFGALVAPENQNPELVFNAFPILFLSFVYQSVVPTVVKQLEGDRDKITKAIIAGTAVPLVLYLAWNAIILGNVYYNVAGAPGALDGNLDPIALLQSGDHGGQTLRALVGGFSELAITTSLIGFVYGTIDVLTDVVGLPTAGPRYERWKPALFAATFVPPVALSLAKPDIFFQALDYSGAFGVSSIFLVLPAVMVWKQRYGEDQSPLTVEPMVPFGKIPLGSLWKAAATLFVEQGADKLGVIDFVKDTFDIL